MRIVETPTFFRQVSALLSDLEHWTLQDDLARSPTLGKLIPGGGGIRKLRWGVRGKGQGKRGGVRVIYYFHALRETLLFLLIYGKNEREDITSEDLKGLARLVKEQFK